MNARLAENTASRGAPVLAEPLPAEREVVRGPSLLDAILQATPTTREPAASRLEQFLGEPSPFKALALWLGWSEDTATLPTKEQLARRLGRDVARLDALLSGQANAILHHPAFQKLEASWRGLRFLVEQPPEDAPVKIRVLNVSWRELVRDLERAVEFDQSQLFRKVYEEEFGHPGGEPFGVLLGDYEIQHRPTQDPPVDHLATLTRIAQTAAAAFAPFIAAAHPALLTLDGFAELEKPLNLPRTFEHPEYLAWRAFRQSEDARFVGLTLPRVLLRVPYRDAGVRLDGFRFREEVEAPDRSRYLWGNAAYAFGAVLIRAFGESRWLADIRGIPPAGAGGGLVTGLPVHSFGTDPAGVVPKCSTEVVVTDAQEKELSDLGLIPLCHCHDTDLAAFYSNESVQKPLSYDRPTATANAQLSSMLQYILCASRFAHYLKVICRDRLGSFGDPARLEDYLNKWLREYTTQNDKAGPDVKARYPLREAKARIRERDGRPGSYLCEIALRPHFQLDQMVAAVKLVTELTPARSS